jgi:hypothetical protein
MSLPASGSVIAAPIMAFPCGMGGMYFFFCSSVPKFWINSVPNAARRTHPHPGSTRQNSSVMSAASK